MSICTTQDRDNFIRRIADYEKISAIFWLILAIVQIFSVVAVIAGIWNLFASISRFAMIKKISLVSPDVPSAYEGVAQLIIIGLINLFLGAVIGIVFVALDFYIRDQILKNKHIFSPSPDITPENESSQTQSMSDTIVQQLERLASLREKGNLTETEFLNAKRQLFGSSPM